jgi:hypothetical protein
LPDGLDLDEQDDETEGYSKGIEAPIYEPTGEQPTVTDLYGRDFTNKLTKEILAADIPEDVRAFLLSAAERHTRFDFRNIAEYYAHAPQHVQHLMERSALVVIDFEQALELGYISMSEKTRAEYEVDNA